MPVTLTRSKALAVRFAALLSLLGASRAHAADPTIHVDWEEPGTPALDFDYVVETAPPASAEFPDVKLLTGSLT